jgi:hypothetical protein
MKALSSSLLALAALAFTGVSAVAQAPGDLRPATGASDSPHKPIAPDPHADSPPVPSKPDARTDSSASPVQTAPSLNMDLRSDSRPEETNGPVDLGPGTPAFLDLGLDAGLPAPADGWVEHPLRSGEEKHLQSASPASALTQPPEPTPLETGAPPEPHVDHFSPAEPPVVTTVPAEPAVAPATQPPPPAAGRQQAPLPPPSTTMPSLPDPFRASV